jgi:hypothetical protein
LKGAKAVSHIFFGSIRVLYLGIAGVISFNANYHHPFRVRGIRILLFLR